MAITYHKAITDDGGVIGDAISSGGINALFSEISLDTQLSGATISRKLYIANSDVVDVDISSLSMDNDVAFQAILFESSGDSQVVGDLTGSEVDESPITITIPASGHKSFWVQLDVPSSSSITLSYGSADIKQIQ